MARTPTVPSPTSEREVAPDILGAEKLPTTVPKEAFASPAEGATEGAERNLTQLQSDFEKQQKMADDAMADKIKAQILQSGNDFISNLKQQKLENALPYDPQNPDGPTSKWMQKITEDATGQVQNPKQAAAVNKALLHEGAAVHNQARDHVDQQKTAIFDNGAHNTMEGYIQNAVTNVDFPNLLDLAHKNYKDKVQDYLNTKGTPMVDEKGNAIPGIMTSYMDKYHGGVLESMIDKGQIKRAKVYLDQYRDEMSETEIHKIEAGFHTYGTRQESFAIADHLIRSNDNLGEALLNADRYPDENRNSIKSYIRANWKKEREVLDKPLETATGMMQQATPGQNPIETVGHIRWNTLSEKDKDALWKVQTPPREDSETFLKFQDALKDNELKGMTRGQFIRDYYSQLTADHRDYAQKRYDEANTKGATTNFSDANLSRDVIMEMRQAGLVTKPVEDYKKLGPRERKNFVLIHDFISKQVDALGRKPTSQEVRDMVDEVIKNRVNVQKKIFGGPEISFKDETNQPRIKFEDLGVSDVGKIAQTFRKYNPNFQPDLPQSRQLIEEYANMFSEKNYSGAASILNSVRP